jgi:hypothetical protein
MSTAAAERDCRGPIERGPRLPHEAEVVTNVRRAAADDTPRSTAPSFTVEDISAAEFVVEPVKADTLTGTAFSCGQEPGWQS